MFTNVMFMNISDGTSDVHEHPQDVHEHHCVEKPMLAKLAATLAHSPPRRGPGLDLAARGRSVIA